MRNSKADKRHFASSNHETAELDFPRNVFQCISLPYKKHLLLTNFYNPNFQHTIKTQNTYQNLVTTFYPQRPLQT